MTRCVVCGRRLPNPAGVGSPLTALYCDRRCLDRDLPARRDGRIGDPHLQVPKGRG